MSWEQPMGSGVDSVREALHALTDGSGDYDALKAAVGKAKFAVRPTALSVDELAANWEYQPMTDTFTDTVQAALFSGDIDMDQYNELSGMAQFTAPHPSRVN